MKKIYGGSDYHFDHFNVIKYDSRPYANIEEMNEDIIEKHNKLVKPGDDFYYLGDICFSKNTEFHLKRLNGNKFFIKGNHDSTEIVKLYKQYGHYLGEQSSYIKIADKKVVLNHFRMMVWDQSHRGALHFYGHSHGALSHLDTTCQDLYTGPNNFYPWDLEQQVEILSKKDFKEL